MRLVVLLVLVGVVASACTTSEPVASSAVSSSPEEPSTVTIGSTTPVFETGGEIQEPGRRCYEFNDYAIVHLQLTIHPDQSIVGEGRASINGGRDFDQSQYFEGVIVRGKTANLDITTTSDGRQVETRESWSFVDGGLRQGSRVYNQVDCSTVVATFDDSAEG